MHPSSRSVRRLSRGRLALAATLAAVFVPALARPLGAQPAPNLLVNGDFAAGLTAFTVTRSSGYVVSWTNECSLRGPHGGIPTCAVFGTPGGVAGTATLAQTVATTPGQTYVASFVTDVQPAGADFSVFLAAAGREIAVECIGAPFCVLTLPFTATAAETPVELGVRGFVVPGGPPSFASGTLVGDAAVTVAPEPAPTAALGAALALLGVGVARRRRA